MVVDTVIYHTVDADADTAMAPRSKSNRGRTHKVRKRRLISAPRYRDLKAGVVVIYKSASDALSDMAVGRQVPLEVTRDRR